MSDSFEIQSHAGAYTVTVGQSLLSLPTIQAEGQLVICDAVFAPALREAGIDPIAITADEGAKSLDQMEPIIVAMKARGANRKTRVLAIGGGVIQDIATFVTSTYMRGLSWDYLPTTLLGMVDSCIGGKSSINVGPYKNLIGNFYPPRAILIDTDYIRSLNPVQRAAGLCEAVKICFAHTGDAFERYLAMNPQTQSSTEVFGATIELSLLTKRWFIEIDEHDQKERLLLNYGHTFGHAIEGSCGFCIPHGIAVGLGMLAAIDCARRLGHYEAAPARVAQLQAYTEALLDSLPDMPAWVARIEHASLLDRFEADKKHTGTHYAVIVPDAKGYLERKMLPKSAELRAELAKSFRAACARWA